MFLSIQNYSEGKYTLSSTFLSSAKTTHHNNPPIPNKWLQGDIVNEDTKAIITREPKAHRTIAGIIDFVNRTRIGLSPKGVPLYNFHPYDPSYPTMVVASKMKHSYNVTAIASLEHWNDKHPRAGIQYIHGPVGNQKDELTTLRQGLATPRTVDPNTKYKADTVKHDEMPWEIVFNIDPLGCEDVDDVMGWRTMNLGIEFFIGIVDIAAWIPEGTPADEDAAKAAQTFYVDGKPVEPMFPHAFSTKIASLRADNVKRPILALVYTIDDFSVIKTEWRLINTPVTMAFTYESVTADIVVTKTLKSLLTIVTKQPPTDDPHIWVEQAMILYNTEAAKVLKQHQHGILRRHAAGQTETCDQYATLAALAKKTGINELAYLAASSGEYVHADEPDANTHHAGLNTDSYCHASSPLRRYADVINHRWLRNILFGFQRPTGFHNAEYLNQRARTIKKFERLIWFLSNLSNDGSITTAQAVVLSYENTTKKAKVYVPAWKRTIKAGHTTAAEYEPGQRILIRAFVDLKATSINQRVVCTMNPVDLV